MKNYGDRLNAALAHAGKHQKDLVKALPISQQTISKLCSGKYQSSECTARIAKFLDVEPLWLECGEGEMLEYIILPEQFEVLRHKLSRNKLKVLSKLSVLLSDNLNSIDELTIENLIDTFYIKNRVQEHIHA